MHSGTQCFRNLVKQLCSLLDLYFLASRRSVTRSSVSELTRSKSESVSISLSAIIIPSGGLGSSSLFDKSIISVSESILSLGRSSIPESVDCMEPAESTRSPVSDISTLPSSRLLLLLSPLFFLRLFFFV